MKTIENKKIDRVTKKAWVRNWEHVSIGRILEIFEYERVKKQMDIFLRVLPKNEKILEGGCGLAPYLIRLRQLGYDVEGIDYNQEPISAVLQYDSKLPVRVGDVMAIPYPDNYFGGYMSLGVIEHFTEGPVRAIREAYRVLKPGGVFVVLVPQNHFFMRITAPIRFLKRNEFLRKVFKKPLDTKYWEQYFRKDELCSVLGREGFDVHEVHPLDHSAAVLSFSDHFRDKTTYDDTNQLGLKIGRWCEKYFPWSTAAQLVFVAYKR
jgi:SAM-dependent methyltransferase